MSTCKDCGRQVPATETTRIRAREVDGRTRVETICETCKAKDGRK
jgi:RNase P subunit RPR2